jgi:hypothetical protein
VLFQKLEKLVETQFPAHTQKRPAVGKVVRKSCRGGCCRLPRYGAGGDDGGRATRHRGVRAVRRCSSTGLA